MPKARPRIHPAILAGDRYGRLTVNAPADPYVGPDGRARRKWVCTCDCGKVLSALEAHLYAPGPPDCGVMCAARRSDPTAPRPKRTIYPSIVPGDRFGKLVAVAPAAPYINTYGAAILKWQVRCDCGSEVVRLDNHLKRGSMRDCGCSRPPIEVGTRFGSWVVLGKAGAGKMLCRCDCGAEKPVNSFSLKHGESKSCGHPSEPSPHAVAKRERMGPPRPRKTHGLSDSSEYRTWVHLIRRCTDPKDPAYSRYGGRGIAVSPRWSTSFAAFYADMGPRPSKRHTLDRLDNDGDYAPGNCEWRLWEDQNRNRRNTVFVETDMGPVPFAQLVAEAGADYCNAHRRYFQLGWSLKDALHKATRSRRLAP